MTIQYKDSKRIVGLSSDVVETLTFEDDFENGNNWTLSTVGGGSIAIASGSLTFTNAQELASGTRATHDMGSGVVNSTAWTMRYKWSPSSLSGGVNHHLMTMSSVDVAGATASYNPDWIGVSYLNGVIQWVTQAGANNTWAGGSTSISVSAGNTYYIELARTAQGSLKLSIFSDSSYTTHLTNSPATFTSVPSGLTDDLRYMTVGCWGGASNKPRTDSFDDVKFYNGVSSLTSKPTDVQDNSIMVEKDTGKRYWFSAGTAISFEDDYTSNTGWTQTGSKVTVDSGKSDWVDANAAATNDSLQQVIKSLGITLSDTAWTADFTYINNGGTVGGYPFVFQSGTGNYDSASNDAITMSEDNPNKIKINTKNGGTYVAGSSTIAVSSGTTYYIRIQRTSATDIKLSAFTDSARTIHTSGSPVTASNAGIANITGLTYVQHQNQTTGGGGTSNFEITDLKIYNNSTSAPTTATWIGNFDLTGLKAYYKFDESSGNIINQATSVGSSDSLGSNADMTISGATYSKTGKIGNALSFDGSNDYGTLGSSLSQWNLFHGTGDWSINFWINYDEFVAESRFFSNMDSTETRGINFAVGWSGNPDGQIGLSIKSDNGFMTNNGGIGFGTDISGTGTWVMITLVADYSDTTNTYTVYLNGVAGSSVARAVAGSTGDSEYSLKLASRGNYADKFFDGLFDEMTIWSRVLTADEITSLYNANIGKIVY